VQLIWLHAGVFAARATLGENAQPGTPSNLGMLVMIRIISRNAAGHVECDVPVDKVLELLQSEGSTVWIDMQMPSPDEYQLVLEHTFHFHPLAIEDAMNDIHLPKIDDYGTYLYLVFHTVGVGKEPMAIETEEVDVFLNLNYLVTIHDQPRRSIDRSWDVDHHATAGLARGPAMLLYELLDSQIDSYIPVIDAFEDQLERLGDDIFKSNENERVLLNRLLTAKSSSLRLQRILTPQRELLGRLATNEYRAIPPPVRIYYRDVYDHLARLTNLAESTRDLAGSTIETHLALVNNRLNEVMKILTIMSSIFIPLSFIAGIYGMNFEFMPELSWRWGYPLVWLVFLTVGFGMLSFFRRRKWI
jgi:magnesium transporter